MSGKNKGGREVRKPKQPKAAGSAAASDSLLTSQPKPKGR